MIYALVLTLCTSWGSCDLYVIDHGLSRDDCYTELLRLGSAYDCQPQRRPW